MIAFKTNSEVMNSVTCLPVLLVKLKRTINIKLTDLFLLQDSIKTV